jgi:predicted RNA-binding protein with RPS1 domain
MKKETRRVTIRFKEHISPVLRKFTKNLESINRLLKENNKLLVKVLNNSFKID